MNHQADILQRLRSVLNHDRSVEVLCIEAALEIEDLRHELQNVYEITKTMTQTSQSVETLTDQRNVNLGKIIVLQDELIKALRAGLDETRRRICELDADTMEDQREYAKQRGWDCFKQEDGK